ncbi:hypothetical protein ACFS6G_18730 [Peribacillus deserti]
MSLALLIEDELNEMIADIMSYAMAYYQREMESSLEEYYQSFDIPDEARDMFHFFAVIWFIFCVEINGTTIMAEYADKHERNYRPRIKDILQKWKSGRPSITVIKQQVGDLLVTVEDLFTKEEYKMKVKDKGIQVDIGGLVLGVILPAGDNSICFSTFLDTPAVHSQNLKNSVFRIYEASGTEDPKEFMAESFLKVLHLCMFGEAEELVWSSEKHKEVAENFKEFMMDEGQDEAFLRVGVCLWSDFCSRKNPVIKKSEIYEAALIYLVDKLVPFGGYYTQRTSQNDTVFPLLVYLRDLRIWSMFYLMRLMNCWRYVKEQS